MEFNELPASEDIAAYAWINELVDQLSSLMGQEQCTRYDVVDNGPASCYLFFLGPNASRGKPASTEKCTPGGIAHELLMFTRQSLNARYPDLPNRPGAFTKGWAIRKAEIDGVPVVIATAAWASDKP